MYPLFETIKIVDGIPQDLDYHQKRFERSYFQMYRYLPKLNIPKILDVPDTFAVGKVKCRFCYNKLEFAFSFQKYFPKKIESLRLVHNNKINYALKYTDRSQLDLLLKRKEDCDEIIIVKNGFITDTSYANLVFCDGEEWFTPAKPLLAGTKRDKLLQNNVIQERSITVKDLPGFSKLKLINAMLDFEEQPMIDISALKI